MVWACRKKNCGFYNKDNRLEGRQITNTVFGRVEIEKRVKEER